MRSAMMLPNIKPGRIRHIEPVKDRVSAFSCIEEDAQRHDFEESNNVEMKSLSYVYKVKPPTERLNNIKSDRMRNVEPVKDRVSAFSCIEEDTQRHDFEESNNVEMKSLSYVYKVKPPTVRLK